MYNTHTMGHEIDSGLKMGEAQGDMLRRAEFYANIALTDVFANGAAVTSQGVLVYPFLDAENLDPKNKDLFDIGRITKVKPEEISVDITSPAKPPVIFLIPPKSLERLALKEHFSRGREVQSSVMLYNGVDENDKPIVDHVTSCSLLMAGLRKAALENIKRHGLNPAADLKVAPTTIAKNALFDMAKTFGAGSLNEAVQKTIEKSRSEEQEFVAGVEKFLNGDK